MLLGCARTSKGLLRAAKQPSHVVLNGSVPRFLQRFKNIYCVPLKQARRIHKKQVRGCFRAQNRRKPPVDMKCRSNLQAQKLQSNPLWSLEAEMQSFEPIFVVFCPSYRHFPTARRRPPLGALAQSGGPAEGRSSPKGGM